jgi:predicted site-specific integrase-resolvase
MERTEYLSEKLLARRWGVSHRTLERWRHDAHGPAYLKVGGRIVYRIEDVEAYEATRRRDPISSLPQAGGGAR